MRIIGFLLLISLSTASSASGWATQDGSAIITAVTVEGGIVKVTYTANDISEPDGCGNQGTIILNDDTTNGDRQYSALLAAHMSQRPIKLYVSGCYTGWNQTWPKLWSVFVL